MTNTGNERKFKSEVHQPCSERLSAFHRSYALRGKAARGAPSPLAGVNAGTNDKAKSLAQAGFTSANPETLKASIQGLLAKSAAIEDAINEYGTFYRLVGELEGVNGIALSVVTIWLQREADGKFQFATLKLLKEA